MREWLIDNGIWGVALLMFLQNIIPLVPSEVIMPLAGFLASLGYLDIKYVVLAGLLGSVLGHLPWYFLGAAMGEDRLESFVARQGRFVFLRRSHVQKAGDWFDRHSVKAVLLGRLVPGLRTCVNIPAGASRMAFLPYLIYTLIGDAVWTTLLGYGGYGLGRDYPLIARYLHLAIWPLAAAACAALIWAALRRHMREQRPA
jgi:membrane protein DedA with SNARE-associated domain